jgi:hypothetical protein
VRSDLANKRGRFSVPRTKPAPTNSRPAVTRRLVTCRDGPSANDSRTEPTCLRRVIHAGRPILNRAKSAGRRNGLNSRLLWVTVLVGDLRARSALPASVGDRKRSMWGSCAVIVALVWAWLSLLPVPDSCRVLRAGGRVKGRAAPAQRRHGRPWTRAVWERIVPGGGAGSPAVGVVQLFRLGVAFLRGGDQGGDGRGRGRSSQPYLGARGAGAAPATR